MGQYFQKIRARPRAMRRGQCACFWFSWVKIFEIFFTSLDMYLQNNLKQNKTKQKQSDKNVWVASHEALFSCH